jgi:hypothetical protein
MMRTVISLIAAAVAALVLDPVVQADPGVCPPDARSCPAVEQQLMADMAAGGIGQDPVHQSEGGLISGARNTVCPSLDGGEPENSVAAELEKYSGFTQPQADIYIHDAVRFYCPGDAAKLS